jgi:hypothetical protein
MNESTAEEKEEKKKKSQTTRSPTQYQFFA